MHGTLKPPVAYEADQVAAQPRRRWWVWAVVALLVAGAAAWFLTRGDEKAAAAAAGTGAGSEAEKPRVTVVVPGRAMVASEIQATGSIAARRTSPVGVQGEGGLVTAVLVAEGSFVGRGQVLARIDRAVQSQQVVQMQAGIRQAQADAQLAQAELDRAQSLVARGFISKADIDRKTATRDSARARVDVARAQVGEMQARVERLDVRAPDSGLILTRAVEPGQVVSAGSPALFTMAQGGLMEMRAQIAEQELAIIRLGQPVNVRLVGSDRSFDGQVSLIEPIIDQAARQGLVRILLGRDPALRPGAFARATIRTGQTDAPLLPQSAILADDKGNYVMIVDRDGKVSKRQIALGAVSARGIAVRSGLDGSERVVESAAAFLNPGETVIPVFKTAARQ